MDLTDRIKELANRIPDHIQHIQTEEATKNALIMPFIGMLGYDVFNPTEVIPEFTADVGTKKGEKVDYAIKKDSEIIILIECKWLGEDLNIVHASQLFRYFSATEARFAILTNGIEYQFYSDIDEPNKMDRKPFFVFTLSSYQAHDLKELKKFSKSSFSLDEILTTASTLKYTGAIKKILDDELSNPTEPFVRFFASQIYDGRLTQAVLDQFREIVKEARKQYINEKINERLKSAMSVSDETTKSKPNGQNNSVDIEDDDDGIITTEEEIEAYNIVKAILRDSVDVNRIFIRDTKSYCGILLDDNNRKPLCRLHFNSSKKYIGIFSNKKEEKLHIEDLNDIFNHSDLLKKALDSYS